MHSCAACCVQKAVYKRIVSSLRISASDLLVSDAFSGRFLPRRTTLPEGHDLYAQAGTLNPQVQNIRRRVATVQ